MQTAYIGQTITFQCKYDHKFKRHTKVFYRVNVGPVHVLNSSQSSQSSEEKFILSDSHKDHFNVTIRDISPADDGVYLCGVERDQSDKRPSETSITHIIFIKEICLNVSMTPVVRCRGVAGNSGPHAQSLLWAPHQDYVQLGGGHDGQRASCEGPLLLTPLVGREGDSAEIKCHYDADYSKEMCLRNGKCLINEIKLPFKGKCFTQDAQNIIHSGEEHVKNTRISTKDDTELNLFTVTITDLRAEDAGKYCCEVKGTLCLSIDLMVIMKDGITHEASVGGSVSISCKYIRKQNQVFFCRGDQPNICVRDGVRVSSDNRINSRFSLTDQTSAGVFTVNISNLTEEDSGKYWCGEEHSGSFIFTEVHLHVNREMTTSDTKETSQNKEKPEMTTSDTKKETAQETKKPVTEMTTSPTKTETSQDEEKTEMISSDTKTESAHVTEKPEMTTSDTKKETLQETKKPVMSSSDSKMAKDQQKEKFGFPVIAVVSGGLILLALVIVLILIKLKHNRHGIISSTERRQTGDDETAQEQIQDTRRHSDSDHESTHLYSTVQLPTNPCDSQNPLYSTVLLPTNPSDSQNALYSTVQLPTTPSDELMYSSISFQKHGKSLSDAAVRFSKEENYASVNHSIIPK
ncbi:hypothetical protein QQF64_000304 [Cirrhinus molitorella]|uniref:Ig-like domain-containing protein n=1 Tax=Cirrhinus molitorella TaxID=172907 RepID=A0ABR3NWX4_9TELE